MHSSLCVSASCHGCLCPWAHLCSSHDTALLSSNCHEVVCAMVKIPSNGWKTKTPGLHYRDSQEDTLSTFPIIQPNALASRPSKKTSLQSQTQTQVEFSVLYYFSGSRPFLTNFILKLIYSRKCTFYHLIPTDLLLLFSFLYHLLSQS